MCASDRRIVIVLAGVLVCTFPEIPVQPWCKGANIIERGSPVPPASTIQKALKSATVIDSSCAPSSPAGPASSGSNLADTLAQHHDVVIIDNLATGRRENIEHLLDHPRVTFAEGSITDHDFLMEVLPGADGILAGPPGAPVGVGSCLERGERDRNTQCTRRGERLQDAGRGCGILGLR
jgi:hypothetical protein